MSRKAAHKLNAATRGQHVSRSDTEFMLQTLDPASRNTHPGLELLHLLLSSLHGDLFRFIQTVLQIFDGLLHVLLHTLQVSAGVLVIKLELSILGNSLIPAASLSLKRALQGVNGPLQVPLALLHLFIFLNQFTLHVSLNLVEL
uniref:Uncharacterized protein n=1 Tax=Amphiprion ocellaris TaxID=80972 RepID=A0A3Q1B1U7_AMPOC